MPGLSNVLGPGIVSNIQLSASAVALALAASQGCDLRDVDASFAGLDESVLFLLVIGTAVDWESHFLLPGGYCGGCLGWDARC